MSSVKRVTIADWTVDWSVDFKLFAAVITATISKLHGDEAEYVVVIVIINIVRIRNFDIF